MRASSSAALNLDPISRLVLSEAPVLILEIDGAEHAQADAIARRPEVRLVGCMRQGARARQQGSQNGSLSAVLVLRSLAPSRLLGWIRSVTGSDARMPPELIRQLLPEHGNHGADTGEWQLTRREYDVLRLLADGESTREIAVRLSYSERTVKNVVHELLVKLNCRTRAHAVALAARRGLI